MERTVVTKEIILQKGIPFDNLANEYCSDRMLNREGGIYSFGICISNKKWDEQGNLTYEKVSPAEKRRIAVYWQNFSLAVEGLERHTAGTNFTSIWIRCPG